MTSDRLVKVVVRQIANWLDREGLQPISNIIFPPPAFDTIQRYAQAAALMQPEYAQLAVGALLVCL